MMRGKCDTTQNISCSISFFSTFRGNFDFFLDSVHTVQYSSSLGQHLSQITAAHYTVKPNLFQSRETIPSDEIGTLKQLLIIQSWEKLRSGRVGGERLFCRTVHP